MVFLTAVHTTGVNWDGVLANVASITVILGAFGALLLRAFRKSIKDEIAAVIHSEITPLLVKIQSRLDDHDIRLAMIEGIEEGKKQAIAAAGVTTKETA